MGEGGKSLLRFATISPPPLRASRFAHAPRGYRRGALGTARLRAGAWAGGELHAWASGDRTAVAFRLVNRPSDYPLCRSIKLWRTAARVKAVVRCVGRHVRVGIAPDKRTAARLVSS